MNFRKHRISSPFQVLCSAFIALNLLVSCAPKSDVTTTGEDPKNQTSQSVTQPSKENGTATSTTANASQGAVTTPDDTNAKDGGTFVVAIGKEPGGYNPAAAADDAAYIVNQNIFNKLLKINGDNEIIPDLAESYQFAPDGKKLTFTLKPNIKWHDGKDFSAEDVKWTFDQIIKEKGFASNSLKNVKEIKVVDKDHIEFNLANPDAGILGYIAWMGTYVMPKHLYEGKDWLTNPVNQKPVGTGPFKFVEHKSGDSVVIEKNPDFFGDKAKVDKIIFKIMPDQMSAYQAWLADEVDETRLDVPSTDLEKLSKDPRYNFIPVSWPNKSYVCFNMKEGKFTDPKVREAILFGINPDEFFTKVFKGQGAVSQYFIPPQYKWALNENVKQPARDVAKAQKLLEEAGYKKDKDGFYFETTVDTYPGWDEFVPVMKQQFKEIGIKLNHNSMDDPTYDAKVLEKQDFELTLLGGYMGPDISSLKTRFGTKAPMNYGLYTSEEMDKALDAGAASTDEKVRADHYKKVQEILRKDLPAVFFYDRGGVLVAKSYVKGHPAGEAKAKSSEAEFTYVWLDK